MGLICFHNVHRGYYVSTCLAGKIPTVSHKLTAVHYESDTRNSGRRGQSGMQWMAGTARKRGWIFVTVAVAGGIAGLVAGPDVAAQTKELTPAEVVAHRFPPAWSNLTPAQAPPVTTVTKQQL